MKQTTKEDELMIETILVEADAWGLRYEVTRDAKQYLEAQTADDAVGPAQAYIWAYEEWIK
jgi:hypothetical protein